MKPFRFGEGEVSNAGVLVQLGAIGAVMLSVAGAFAYTGGWLSPVRLTQDRMMAAFQQLAAWSEFSRALAGKANVYVIGPFGSPLPLQSLHFPRFGRRGSRIFGGPRE